jgi:hypothetical protein
MNSVFSAFKSGKNESNKKNSKKHLIAQDPPTSYEKLRHLREVTSNSNFVSEDDQQLLNLKLDNKKCPSIKTTPVQSPSCEHNDIVVDLRYMEENVDDMMIDEIDHGLFVEQYDRQQGGCNDEFPKPINDPTMPNSTLTATSLANEPTNNQLSRCSSSSSNDSDTICSSVEQKSTSSVVAALAPPPSPSNTPNTSSSSTLLAEEHQVTSLPPSSQQKHQQHHHPIPSVANSNRLHKPRLSISNGFNLSAMPSVHGRTCNNSPKNANGQQRTRLSTHQRNLSLDFR